MHFLPWIIIETIIKFLNFSCMKNLLGVPHVSMFIRMVVSNTPIPMREEPIGSERFIQKSPNIQTIGDMNPLARR